MINMSFINTIEDDSDQVELIVRQRLEAKPGCNIVGFDAFDQATAVTQLSTDLESNSSLIDGIITSLSDTDANVIALNSNLLAAISNTASNTVTNASLASGLRVDVDSHSTLISNLQANTVAIAADLASNSVLVSGLRTDLDANANLLSNTTARITVVEQNTSNLSNLTNTVTEHTTDILNLEQSVNLLDSIEGALDGNSSALAALTGASVSWALTLFNAVDKAATKVKLDQTRDTIAEVFGTTSNNWESISSSNGYSLTNNSNITQLQNQMTLVRAHTDTTSVRQIKINGNSSNITSLQSNTAQLATAINIHTSNIGSLNQSINTIETDINSLTSSLTDNSTRITTVSGDLASNVSRIEQLETTGGGGAWTTSGSDI